jgi:hypothetical protein
LQGLNDTLVNAPSFDPSVANPTAVPDGVTTPRPSVTPSAELVIDVEIHQVRQQ